MQLRSVDTVTVVAQPTRPDEAVGVERAPHDALLEAHDLVGMLDRINPKR